MRARLVSMVGAEWMPGQPYNPALEIGAAAVGLMLRPALDINHAWVCNALLPFRVVLEARYRICGGAGR